MVRDFGEHKFLNARSVDELQKIGGYVIFYYSCN